MQIVSIQVLRALAALTVAVGHGQAFIGMPLEKLGRDYDWSYLLPWGAGVDLFFVISGFIMVYSSEQLFAQPGGAQTFMWRRLTRIVPLYWAAMALILVKITLQHKPQPDLVSLVSSFLFVPWDTQGTGVPRPIYELGWTLNYEMFFYATFALFVGLPRVRAVALTAGTLATMVALGAIFRFTNPMLFVWTQPIVLEFVFGMGLALLARNGVTLPHGLRYSLIALGVAALLGDFLHSQEHPHAWVTPNDFLRVFGWGVPAAMILAGAVLKRRERAPGPIALAGVALGDASYALYLCHPMVMTVFSRVWLDLGGERVLEPHLAVALEIALSIAASLAVYRWFEKPLTRFLQDRRQARLNRAAAMAAPRISA